MTNKYKKIVSKTFLLALVFLLGFQGFMFNDRTSYAASDLEALSESESKVTSESEINEMTITDFGSGEPLDLNVVNESQNWGYRYINGDLYIGPEAVLTINGNVTVDGDIYVLGAIVSYGTFVVNGTFHANRFIWGGNTTLYNGTVNIRGGVNNIRGQSASNRPLRDIPIEIHSEPIISENGMVKNIDGATVPIADLSVEGKNVELNVDGTFSTGNIELGNKEKLTFTFTDVFGNTITKEFPVEVHDTISPTATINQDGGVLQKC